MGLSRGYGEDTKVEGYRRNSGPRIFFVKAGEETQVILLDDDPVECVRHQLYLKDDKDAAGLRQTCAGMNPREHPEPVPKLCKVCNSMIRHKDQIGRNLRLYSSLIEERQYTFKGQQFQDMKLLLELDGKGGQVFRQKKKTYGRLIGARFRVYRTKGSKTQTSPRYGDNWEFIEHVDLVRHFWQSPAIARIMEANAKRGERPLTHEQAVAMLIRPIDYDSTIGIYKPEEADTFVAYIDGFKSDGAGGYQPPPPPPSSMPSYAVPPGQVPSYAGQPSAPPPGYGPPPGAQGYAPPYPGQQAPAPPPPAPQGYPAPPPPGYGAPPAAFGAPQPWQQQPQQAPAPQGYQAPPMPPAGYAAPPPPQGAPPQGGDLPPWETGPGAPGYDPRAAQGFPPGGPPSPPQHGVAAAAQGVARPMQGGQPYQSVPRAPQPMPPVQGQTPQNGGFTGSYAPPPGGYAPPPVPDPRGATAPAPAYIPPPPPPGTGYAPPGAPPQGHYPQQPQQAPPPPQPGAIPHNFERGWQPQPAGAPQGDLGSSFD